MKTGSVANSYLYLISTSGRNRFLTLLRRARSPRYGAALVVGAVYIWAFLVRPANTTGATTFLLGRTSEMIVTLLAVITLMGSWLFGSDITALAFSQAEVSFLFPAPVTRRSLIVYKLMRAQVAVLVNALIWVFVLRRGGTALPSPLRAVSLWILFSTLNFHRLGAALVRASVRAHGGVGARRTRTSIVAFALVGAALVGGAFAHRAELRAASDPTTFLSSLGHVLAQPPAYWGLYPFHLVVAPTFARSVAEWGRLIGPAVAVMLLHAWWVLHTDAAFEDAALEASAERAKRAEAMRSRRSIMATSVPRAPTSTLPLAAHGHPSLAILWKNTLCLRRTAQLRVFVGPVIMAALLGSAFGSGLPTRTKVAMSALVLAGMLIIFGGRLIRNDLRQDMQHLPLLKTLPIAPSHIVLAEVASAAIPMTIVQIVLVAIAFVAFIGGQGAPFGTGTRLALLISSPAALLAINGALVTSQNATAVLFPAWIRLGPAVTTGVETLGQNVLATAANLLSLVVSLVLPAAAGWGILALASSARASALVIAVIVGAIILAAETYAAMSYLGHALARAEPAQT